MTQWHFDSALDKLWQYLADAETRPGYAGAEVHESQRRVDLYWKGPLPPSLVALLEEVQPACPAKVLPAEHDVVELRRARSRITAAPGFESSGIVVLALEDDGSGLHLEHEGDEPPREFVARLALGVPVNWERGSAPMPG